MILELLFLFAYNLSDLPASREFLFSGLYQQAILKFESELKEYPDNPEQIRYYVLACAAAKNLNRAENFFRTKRYLNDSLNSFIHYGMGLVYEYKGMIDSAIAEYYNAIELDSSNTDVYAGLLLLLARSGKRTESIPQLIKKLKYLYPYQPYQLFVLYKVTNNLAYLVSALELAPQNPVILWEIYNIAKNVNDDSLNTVTIRKMASIIRGTLVFDDEKINPDDFLQAAKSIVPNIENLEPFFLSDIGAGIKYLYVDPLELSEITRAKFTALTISKDSLNFYIHRWRGKNDSLDLISNLIIALLRLGKEDSVKYFLKISDSLYKAENRLYDRGLFYLAAYQIKKDPEMMIRAISSFRDNKNNDEVNQCIKIFVADLPKTYNDINNFSEARKVFEFFHHFYSENHIELEYEDITKLIVLFNFTGLNALGMGDIDLSVTAFELYRKFSHHLKAELDIASAHNNLGLACRIQRDFDRALQSLTQGLQLIERVAPTDFVTSGFIKGNIAWTYFDMGMVDSAEKYFAMAKEPLESLWQNENRMQLHGQEVLAFGYFGLGIVNMAKKNMEPALDNLFKCTEYRDFAGNTFNQSAFALVYNLIGEIYLEMNKLNKAMLYFTRSMEYLGQKSEGLIELNEVVFPAVTMWVMSNRGLIYELQGQENEALKYYQRSIEILEKYRSTIKNEENRSYFIEDKMKIYERAITLLLKKGFYQKAFEYVERAKARVLLELLESKIIELPTPEEKNIFLERKKIEEKINDLKKELQNSETLDKDEINDLNNKFRSALISYDSLIKTVEKKKPELASLINIRQLRLTDVQKDLDNNTTILEYYFTDTSLICFVITKTDLKLVQTKISVNNLVNLINYFRSAIMLLDDNYKEPASELFKTLVEPVKGYLKDENLIIVPHGILHYLPFSALMDADGSYLIDRYYITYLPSSGILQYCLNKKDKPKNNILALGNPDLNNPRFDLPNAEMEVKEVAKYFEKQVVFLRKDATEDRCRIFAGDYNIIHFACHGEFNRLKPMSSSLLLAKGADFLEDGRLEAYEVYGIDLKNARLVILSACESGLSKVTKGDEIIGLLRGFIYAGAPTIIASLWKVSDVSTGRLMTSFYQKLNSGAYSAKALTDAQRELKENNDFNHPFFWAPFNLYGYGK